MGHGASAVTRQLQASAQTRVPTDLCTLSAQMRQTRLTQSQPLTAFVCYIIFNLIFSRLNALPGHTHPFLFLSSVSVFCFFIFFFLPSFSSFFFSASARTRVASVFSTDPCNFQINISSVAFSRIGASFSCDRKLQACACVIMRS